MKKILFLSLLDMNLINDSNIYCDLLREFKCARHNIYIISPIEKRSICQKTIIKEDNVTIIKPKIGNIQKVGFIEKGISTILLEYQILKCIKKELSNVKFDLVLYATPPITFGKVIEYVKKRDNCITYLMLKDIFPQNAVDIGSFSKKSIFYKYFRNKEKKLYMISDYIGCMSNRNIEFVKEHNSYLNEKKITLCPNAIQPKNYGFNKQELRKKFNLPSNKIIYIYGGNLGRPQGIDFLIDCLKSNERNENAVFIIVGSGTEKYKLDEYIKNNNPNNVQVYSYMKKEKYTELLAACDVGMLFLDHRFTIPNYPSRLLSYMELDMPIIAATDPNTDIGKFIEENNIGFWCESNNVRSFNKLIEKTENALNEKTFNGSRQIMKQFYLASNVYKNICKEIGWEENHESV